MSSSILFIFTSADTKLTGGRTGWFLPEASHAYWVLAPHFNIDFAAPKGPNPPVDPASVEAFAKDKESVDFLSDATITAKLENAKKLSEVNADDYVAIYYVGGHGPVIDLPEDPTNIALATKFYNSGKLVTAVCHGTAALAYVKDKDGQSIFKGKRFTGFSDREEEIMGATTWIPFSLEAVITGLGGIYEVADEPWEPKVVVDGHLLTGQNPASARLLGETILKTLKK